MADLAPVAASVRHVSGPYENGVSGEALTPGDAVYKAADGKFYKAQCDGSAIESGTLGGGIVTSGASGVGQNVRVSKRGSVVKLGAGALGLRYVVSTGLGKIAPDADLVTAGTGKFPTVATICTVASDEHKVVWYAGGIAQA